VACSNPKQTNWSQRGLIYHHNASALKEPNLRRMDTANTERILVPVRKAARLRGLYAGRLWTAIRDGSLPAYQIGGWLRVRLADVDTWIEAHRIRRVPPAAQEGRSK